MVSILTSASLATLPIVSRAFSRVGVLDSFCRSFCFTVCRPFALFIADFIIPAFTRSAFDSRLLDQLDRLGHLFPFFADMGYCHQVPSQCGQEDVFSAFLDLRPEGHLDGELFLL